MFKLAQIYDEAKYDVHDLLTLHKIVKNLGMQKQDIINILELIKNDQLQTLQLKAQHLRDEINMLEIEKTRFTNRIVGYNRVINELQSSLAQKRKEMEYMDHESRKYDNTGNLHPVPHSESDSSSHSTRILPYNKD
jgi:chromosome segregation ATPase